jgi:hypothetical protein
MLKFLNMNQVGIVIVLKDFNGVGELLPVSRPTVQKVLVEHILMNVIVGRHGTSHLEHVMTQNARDMP